MHTCPDHQIFTSDGCIIELSKREGSQALLHHPLCPIAASVVTFAPEQLRGLVVPEKVNTFSGCTTQFLYFFSDAGNKCPALFCLNVAFGCELVIECHFDSFLHAAGIGLRTLHAD